MTMTDLPTLIARRERAQSVLDYYYIHADKKACEHAKKVIAECNRALAAKQAQEPTA